MFSYDITKILLPKWILEQHDLLTEKQFLLIVREYLIRYQFYQFVRFDYPFAICDRITEVKERRKRREQSHFRR